MKITRIVVPASTLAAVGLAVCLVLQRQARLKLDVENDVLRGRLSKMGDITAENRRLSNLLSQANARSQRPTETTSTNVVTDEAREELARLRSQVKALDRQSNQLEKLRGDTLATRAALEQAYSANRTNRLISHNNPPAANGASFEILEASYGTDHTNLDVSAALNDRIRNGGLKMVANNNLAGDPDYGNVKSLTVVYRFGGTVLTNQFREGDIVVLPTESP